MTLIFCFLNIVSSNTGIIYVLFSQTVLSNNTFHSLSDPFHIFHLALPKSALVIVSWRLFVLQLSCVQSVLVIQVCDNLLVGGRQCKCEEWSCVLGLSGKKNWTRLLFIQVKWLVHLWFHISWACYICIMFAFQSGFIQFLTILSKYSILCFLFG